MKWKNFSKSVQTDLVVCIYTSLIHWKVLELETKKKKKSQGPEVAELELNVFFDFCPTKLLESILNS